MSERELATHERWEHYRTVVNDDEEMGVRGHGEFSDNFYVEIGEDRYLIEMDGGRIDAITPNPGLNRDWSFGIEGDREAWEEFVQEVPPAFNHEIVASNYRTAVKGDSGHLQLTGSNEKVFQHFRAFQRTLDLMRVAHNDGGDR